MAEERKYLTNEAIEYCESLPERHFSRDPRKFRFYEWLPVQYRNYLPDDGLFVVPGQYYVHQLDYLKEHFDSYIGTFNSLVTFSDQIYSYDYGFWKNLPGIDRFDFDIVVRQPKIEEDGITGDKFLALVDQRWVNTWLGNITFDNSVEGVATALFLAKWFGENFTDKSPCFRAEKYFFDIPDNVKKSKLFRKDFPADLDLPAEEYDMSSNYCWRIKYGLRIEIQKEDLCARLLGYSKTEKFMDFSITFKHGVIQSLRKVVFFE